MSAQANAKAEYTAAYRNERMCQVNLSWRITDRFDYRYNPACDFVATSPEMRAKAHESLLNAAPYLFKDGFTNPLHRGEFRRMKIMRNREQVLREEGYVLVSGFWKKP